MTVLVSLLILNYASDAETQHPLKMNNDKFENNFDGMITNMTILELLYFKSLDVRLRTEYTSRCTYIFLLNGLSFDVE